MKITEETLIRFQKCETTPEEEVAILDWLDADPENQKQLDSLDFQFNAAVLHVEQPQSESRPSRRTNPFRAFIYTGIAAAVALLLAVGNGWYQARQTRLDLESLNTTINVPIGQRIEVTLQDGTRVCLNAGSSLEFPNVFSKRDRKVRLSGEAMFDVMPDADCPFIVETYGYDVEVFGTRFNVEADAASAEFSTALLQGSVKVTDRASGAGFFLVPGEKAELVQGRLRRSPITNSDEYLWTEGIISLQCDSFTELLKRMEKAYDVHFIIQYDKEPVVRCRGKIRVSDGIEHALEILKLGTDFNYEIRRGSNEIYIR
jgi:ferric-dicitrate binding protein FerR (iron transport regulator)